MHKLFETEEDFKYACDWTAKQLSLLKDGGVWGIPRSGCMVWALSHTDKTASIIGATAEPAVVACMEALGWTLTKEK